MDPIFRRQTGEQLTGGQAVGFSGWERLMDSIREDVPGARGKRERGPFQFVSDMDVAADDDREPPHRQMTQERANPLRGTGLLGRYGRGNLPERRAKGLAPLQRPT
jgi:hypothetical protein